MKLHISDLTLEVVSQKNLIVVKMAKGSLPFFQSWTKKVFSARDNPMATSKLAKFAFLIPDGEPFSCPIRKEVRVVPQFIDVRNGHIALATV
jgi:hypothetical protein